MYNLNVLYIKLAQNTKFFRRFVLENLINVMFSLFDRKTLLLWAAEYRPPLCQQATFIECVKDGNAKAFAGTQGGGGGAGIFYIF